LLNQIISKYNKSRNIQEKKKITPLLDLIKKNGYSSNNIYASIGEDAAAIKISQNSDTLILLTTDAILPQFIINSPYAAGLSAVYVGIDDIIAAGGKPIACSTTVSYNNEEMGKHIFQGIMEGTNKFQIPLIRGHTVSDSNDISLTSSTIGISSIKSFLSIKNLRENEFIALVWDIEGVPALSNNNYWNTITMKSSEQFYSKRNFIASGIKKKYITTCKDISNGGILGTLYQMLSYSSLGAVLDLNLLNTRLKKDNFPYELIDFLFLYLTSGFIVCGKKETKENLIKLVQNSNMNFYDIGITTKKLDLVIKFENNKKLLSTISPLSR